MGAFKVHEVGKDTRLNMYSICLHLTFEDLQHFLSEDLH